MPAEFAIPARRNLLLLAGTAGACVGLLYMASHGPQLWLRGLAVVAFSFVANTMFSLLHEAVHGVLHPSHAINRWGGRLAALFFPTSFTLQRAFHLTHHRNNRSEVEQFDYIRHGDVRWLKWAQWYAILTGIYWVVTIFGMLVYLLVPGILRSRLLRSRQSRVAQQTSSRPYLDAIDLLPGVRTRLEIVAAVVFQLGLFVTLDLQPWAWAACYGAFAFHWSSLQYADHAFSPLHPRDGAHNLRVNRLTRALFLNYHYHLVHHRDPQLPWIHLPKFVDPHVEQPSFLHVWCKMWRGPRPLPTQDLAGEQV